VNIETNFRGVIYLVRRFWFDVPISNAVTERPVLETVSILREGIVPGPTIPPDTDFEIRELVTEAL
jgi:hypothetical protein